MHKGPAYAGKAGRRKLEPSGIPCRWAKQAPADDSCLFHIRGLAEKVVVPKYYAEGDSFDLVCRAAGVLMQQGPWGFDDAFDELLGLAIRRGEKLEVTADLVVTLAESGRVLGPDR